MKKHLYILCIISVLLGGNIIRVLAESGDLQEIQPEIASSSIPAQDIQLFSPEIQVVYPLFSDGSSQSALKAGDRFRVEVDAIDILLGDITVDLSELGLSSETPVSDESTDVQTLPKEIPDGTKTITLHTEDLFGNDITISAPVLVDSTPPEGTLQATFSRDEDLSGNWTAYIAGSTSGTGTESIIIEAFTIGISENGTRVGTSSVEATALATILSPFQREVPILPPHLDWSQMSFAMTVLDEAGNTADIVSTPFPLITLDPILANHAVSGSIVTAPNYMSGNAPDGVGIPHTLINGIPKGDYYAVVFFEGLVGCPTAFYAINSFRANAYWGYDVRGPNQEFSKAYSTTAGGCMQRYHVDPARDGDWLWGALDPNHTHSAIADTSGIPAFAICATEASCNLISPQADITPTLPPEIPHASSVLFLPGIKGSSLYKESLACPIVSAFCDIPLWLPLSNLAVPDLFLNADGSSKEEVYTRDEHILSRAYGRSFYDAFAAAMDAYANSTGATWKPIAYDWRRSLSDIVRNGSIDGARISFAEASDTPYIKEELEKLASSSPSGKVTIITHSNGGLVAKKLIQELGTVAAPQLIDAVILVGVPQAGAPRALTSLLFGEGESLPSTGAFAELLMSATNARIFGLLAPMAYHLLPSKAYFDNVNDPSHPIMSFGEGLLLSQARALVGRSIDSLTELRKYALGEDGRSVPAEEDIRSPSVLHANLFEYAVNEHAALDPWMPPAGITVYQIAGWGADTLSGIEMYEYVHDGVAKILYRPQFVEDGDGTVPIPSSLLMTTNERVRRYWIDLPGVATENAWYSHANLFEVPQVEELIQNILTRKTELPAHVYTAQPETINSQKKLLFVLHTEASVRVFDSSRHRSGISSAGAAEDDIPGSQSGNIGVMRYVLVPASDTYAVEITEAKPNSIVLDIQELRNGTVVASTTISSPGESVTFSITGDIESIADIETDSVEPLLVKNRATLSKEKKRVEEILESTIVIKESLPLIQGASEQISLPIAPPHSPKGFAVFTDDTREHSLVESDANSQTLYEKIGDYIYSVLEWIKEWYRTQVSRLRN